MDRLEECLTLEERVLRLEQLVGQMLERASNLPAEIKKRIDSGENAVRAIRRWRLMTQNELAKASGVGVNHISRIENGALFNIRTGRNLASALGVRIDDITEPVTGTPSK
ncbi:MAG: helix-turn-helix transcriptional regulator [Pseudomonadota bacterium]